MAAGVAALEAEDYYAKNCRAIQETRAWTVQALEALGFTVVPSLANFVLAAHKTVDGETIYRELKRRGILVRHFTAPRIANYNRITIGSPEQMALLVQTLGEIL